MTQPDEPSGGQGLNSPDPLVREAFLMAYDYLDYVTSQPGAYLPPPPCPAARALRHAGDELLARFPIFFRRWPRVFQDVTERTACAMLTAMLDEHFGPSAPGGRRRDLAWSAVLSVYVLAGQMALHCRDKGMEQVVPRLKECVGAYVERNICPEIREHGGWAGFISRFGEKQNLEGQVKRVCYWTLLLLITGILTYFLWKRRTA
ncbi:hypothetical protein ACEWY4_012222 [Coilia grayii]|uniref:Bcl-2 Bcl-2 homology region 1-3 domain-containing protein n=1 Tax=Coilia grayii TaxID=363190 RepID=A0ABD1JZW3_9TELE